MNCHRYNEEHGAHNGSSLKHLLHMILCCGLSIVIIGLLSLIARFNPGFASIIAKIAPFLCPMFMIFMMLPMILGSKKDDCCHNTDHHDSKRLP